MRVRSHGQEGKQIDIGEDDLPGESGRVRGFGSEEIPRGLVLAARHVQPKGLVLGGIEDRKGDDAGLAFTAMASLPQQAMLPGTFAFGDLAGLA
jgi:hypothetical protein